MRSYVARIADKMLVKDRAGRWRDAGKAVDALAATLGKVATQEELGELPRLGELAALLEAPVVEDDAEDEPDRRAIHPTMRLRMTPVRADLDAHASVEDMPPISIAQPSA